MVGSLQKLLCFCLIFSFCGLAFAETLEVIAPTLVVQKVNGKVKKLGNAKVGQKFRVLGRNENGKYYKISVSGVEGFIEVASVKIIEDSKNSSAAEVEEQIDLSDAPYVEIGGVLDKALGLGGDLAFLYGLPFTSKLSLDIGIHGTLFPFTVDKVETLIIGALLRLNLGRYVIVSPELSYHLTLVTGTDFAVSSKALGSGVFISLPFGDGYSIGGGARFSLANGDLASKYLVNLRFYF